MDYLKNVNLRGNGRFWAEFKSGAKTEEKECANFFMIMQDKKAKPEEVEAYIKLGKMLDSEKPWAEIERVLLTFQANAA